MAKPLTAPPHKRHLQDNNLTENKQVGLPHSFNAILMASNRRAVLYAVYSENTHYQVFLKNITPDGRIIFPNNEAFAGPNMTAWHFLDYAEAKKKLKEL